MKNQNITLAIIGGGSVATSFVRQFAQKITKKGESSVKEIIVFEPRSHIGAGGAYQEDTSSNLLNTRAGTMSPIASDPNNFIRWLKENQHHWSASFPGVQPTAEAFVPRALFGLYLRHIHMQSAEMLARLGVRLKHVNDSVTGIKRTEGKYEIHTQHGRINIADMTVLAIGNLEGNDWDHLKPNKGYFNSPYPCNKLTQSIDPVKAVCILGSSLSAIDAAVSLFDSGHQGKIVMVSRNGRLPSVRGEHNLIREPKLLSRERVQELASERGEGISLMEIALMLQKELELCDGQSPDLEAILRDGEGPHRYLDSEINDAVIRDRTWQAIVYGLNDSIDLIWHLLSPEDKRVFEAKFKSLWLAYRVSFPIKNALKVQQMLHSNQLSVYGGYSGVSFDNALGLFAVSIDDRKQSFSATLFTDYVVNATGFTANLKSCNSPLLRSMETTGLIKSNEFGGINVDFNSGRVIPRCGIPMKGLYALGSLASGTYFWTNAMNVNARLAAGLVHTVQEDLASLKKSSEIASLSLIKSAMDSLELSTA